MRPGLKPGAAKSEAMVTTEIAIRIASLPAAEYFARDVGYATVSLAAPPYARRYQFREGVMRYMMESPYGHWTEDGARFVYDLDKIAVATGYTVEEVKTYGVPYCRTFSRLSQATNRVCPRS